MVDYQKLCIKLFNEITKTIASLEKLQEEVFNNFIQSNSSKEEAREFVTGLDLKNSSNYKLK